MDYAMEIQQVIYGLLAAQIEFGYYCCGDSLPKIEETSQWLSLSPDTVRSAYLRLKQEGYIRLSKRSGATVIVRYDDRKTEQNIRNFLSVYRDAALDLCGCLDPIFSRPLWFAFKSASSARLDELERLCNLTDIPPFFIVVRHLELLYRPLNNDVLMRLAWYTFMFQQAPLLALARNRTMSDHNINGLPAFIRLCREKDWDGLWHAVSEYHIKLSSSIRRFYEEQITAEPSGQQISFQWSPYEKSSQRCYSLTMELLVYIRQTGLEGRFLPSPSRLAGDRGLSVSTIRRALALLNHLGAVRSINGIGTQVLNPEDSAENCDLSQPVIRKRLVDFAQSLQILALTCRPYAEITFASMNYASCQRCRGKLLEIRDTGRYESTVFTALDFLTQSLPNQAARKIYGQLQQMLLWGYPLRSFHGDRATINAFYLPYIDSMAEYLDRCDGAGLAGELERLMVHEFRFAMKQLEGLGICGSSSLVLP